MSKYFEEDTLEEEFDLGVDVISEGDSDEGEDGDGVEFEQIDFAALGIDPYRATKAKPGSEAKVLMIAARYAAGLPLWHQEDCYTHGPRELDLMGSEMEHYRHEAQKLLATEVVQKGGGRKASDQPSYAALLAQAERKADLDRTDPNLALQVEDEDEEDEGGNTESLEDLIAQQGEDQELEEAASAIDANDMSFVA